MKSKFSCPRRFNWHQNAYVCNSTDNASTYILYLTINLAWRSIESQDTSGEQSLWISIKVEQLWCSGDLKWPKCIYRIERDFVLVCFNLVYKRKIIFLFSNKNMNFVVVHPKVFKIKRYYEYIVLHMKNK